MDASRLRNPLQLQCLMDVKHLRASIDKVWDESILDRLKAYIRIPNQ